MGKNMKLGEVGRAALGLGIAAAMLVAASTITAPVPKMASDMIPIPSIGPAIAKITVTFNKNGGTGTMAKQTVTVKNGSKFKLSANKFTKPGYQFDSWNTKKDGKGTRYANGATVKLTKNTTLYAQWRKVTKVTVTFNKNGATVTGSMTPQTMNAGTSTRLKKNTFTRKNCTFKCWNTKADGKGIQYADTAAVKLTRNTTLYAQWLYTKKK